MIPQCHAIIGTGSHTPGHGTDSVLLRKSKGRLSVWPDLPSAATKAPNFFNSVELPMALEDASALRTGGRSRDQTGIGAIPKGEIQSKNARSFPMLGRTEKGISYRRLMKTTQPLTSLRHGMRHGLLPIFAGAAERVGTGGGRAYPPLSTYSAATRRHGRTQGSKGSRSRPSPGNATGSEGEPSHVLQHMGCRCMVLLGYTSMTLPIPRLPHAPYTACSLSRAYHIGAVRRPNRIHDPEKQILGLILITQPSERRWRGRPRGVAMRMGARGPMRHGGLSHCCCVGTPAKKHAEHHVQRSRFCRPHSDQLKVTLGGVIIAGHSVASVSMQRELSSKLCDDFGRFGPLSVPHRTCRKAGGQMRIYEMKK